MSSIGTMRKLGRDVYDFGLDHHSRFLIGGVLAWLVCLGLHLWIPALVLWYVGLLGLMRFAPRAAVWVLMIGMSIHTLTMCVLYRIGVPSNLITFFGTWKEVLVLLLLVFGAYRYVRQPHNRPRWRAADALLVLFSIYLIWRCLEPAPLQHSFISRLYGLRFYVVFIAAYFAGRVLFFGAAWLKQSLRLLLTLGIVTGLLAIVERFFVPLQFYVEPLGYVRYLKDVVGLTYDENTEHQQSGVLNNIRTEVFGNAPAPTLPPPTLPPSTLSPTTLPPVPPIVGNDHPFWALDPSALSLHLPFDYHTSIGANFVRRAGSVFLSPQPFAMSFLLIIPLALAVTFALPRSRLWWLPFIAMGSGLLLTLARGAIVAVTVALGVGAACVMLDRILRWRAEQFGYSVVQQKRRTWRSVGIWVLGFGLFAIVLYFGPFHSLISRYVTDVITLRDHSLAEHLDVWLSSLSSFRQSPLIGVGLGTGGTVAARFGYKPVSGENQWLMLLSETGIIGFALYFVFLALTITYLWRIWRSTAPTLTRNTALGLIVVLVAIITDGLTAQLYDAWFVPYLFHFFVGYFLTHAQRTQPAPVVVAKPTLATVEVVMP